MMKPGSVTAAHPSSPPPHPLFFTQFCGLAHTNRISNQSWNVSLGSPISLLNLKPPPPPPRLFTVYSSSSSSSNVPKSSDSNRLEANHPVVVVGNSNSEPQNKWKVEVGNPSVPSSYVPPARLSLGDQAFFLLAFIACTTSVAFTSLVIAAVPALYAMGRAAISISKLADTAREELPSTMAAIRLSGMEISDLTLELSDLSQEVADGVSKSAQAVQAAEAGIRQIGSLARHRTMSIIQERASLPIVSLQPVVAGAAKKTSRAVGKATKTFMSIISRGEFSSENESGRIVDRLDI